MYSRERTFRYMSLLFLLLFQLIFIPVSQALCSVQWHSFYRGRQPNGGWLNSSRKAQLVIYFSF